VPKGKADRAYATTAGLGVVPPGLDLGDHRVVPGDSLIVSGPIADHGATVVACRHQLAGESLRSDCAPLASLISALLESDAEVHVMHDPTRGGVATTCNEVCSRRPIRMVIDEASVPIRPPVSAVCDVLGLDPLYVACEGRVLVWVASHDAEKALSALRAHPMGRQAALLGRVEDAAPGLPAVTLKTRFGVERPLDYLAGTDVPRIC
jgi:hydrogenase expression/formation protein HypE